MVYSQLIRFCHLLKLKRETLLSEDDRLAME